MPLVKTEFGLQVREGSSLAAADRELSPEDIVTVCGYCAGAEEKAARVEAAGKVVSHGVCGPHFAVLAAQLQGRVSSREC